MNYKHGYSGEKFYKVWRAIHRRCRISPYYKDISVSKEWSDFNIFKKDMYSSYLKHKINNPSTTIERINNKGDYCKENCRWATWQEQFKNQNKNRYITYKGDKKTISEWSRKLNMHHTLLRHRIKKWGIEKAFTVPILNNKTRHTLKELYK